MCFVGHHDDVVTIGQLGVQTLRRSVCTTHSAELLDQREDVAVIGAQQLLQMLTAGRAHGFFRLGDDARAREVLVDLPIEVFAIGDDEERPVAGHFAQDLLREEDHAVTLAAALRVPEDAQLALIRSRTSCVFDGLDGAIDAEVLMVLGDEFT